VATTVLSIGVSQFFPVTLHAIFQFFVRRSRNFSIAKKFAQFICEETKYFARKRT